MDIFKINVINSSNDQFDDFAKVLKMLELFDQKCSKILISKQKMDNLLKLTNCKDEFEFKRKFKICYPECIDFNFEII